MRRALIAAGLAATLLVAGCSTPSPSLEAAAAERLQQQVLVVTEASAAPDYARALAELDALTGTLTDALANGELTVERHAAIMAAVRLVRAELEALIADAATPEAPDADPTAPSSPVVPNPPSSDPTPTDDGEPDDNGNNGNNGNGDSGNEGNGNSGNEGNGNSGNGNSGNAGNNGRGVGRGN